MILSIDKKGNLGFIPVEENVELVPAISLIFDIDKLLDIDLERFIISESVKNWRHESILLSVALLEK